jgi:hypothetical protein
VRAVRKREAVPIAERKQRLVSIFGNVAEIAAERMEELAGDATLRDAGTTAGIATDKLLLLLGETGGGVPVQINMYTGMADLLHKRYAEMVTKLDARYQAQTSSDPSAGAQGQAPTKTALAVDLQSGEELPKSEEASLGT